MEQQDKGPGGEEDEKKKRDEIFVAYLGQPEARHNKTAQDCCSWHKTSTAQTWTGTGIYMGSALKNKYEREREREGRTAELFRIKFNRREQLFG